MRLVEGGISVSAPAKWVIWSGLTSAFRWMKSARHERVVPWRQRLTSAHCWDWNHCKTSSQGRLRRYGSRAANTSQAVTMRTNCSLTSGVYDHCSLQICLKTGFELFDLSRKDERFERMLLKISMHQSSGAAVIFELFHQSFCSVDCIVNIEIIHDLSYFLMQCSTFHLLNVVTFAWRSPVNMWIYVTKLVNIVVLCFHHFFIPLLCESMK